MKKNIKCRWCSKTNGLIKYYIIADNLEEPKPYHPACLKKLQMEVMMKMCDAKNNLL